MSADTSSPERRASVVSLQPPTPPGTPPPEFSRPVAKPALSYQEKLRRIQKGADIQHTYTQPELSEIQDPEYEFRNINWLHAVLLTSTPALAAYGLATVPLDWRTALWAGAWYVCSGLGITAGYHRLWAHKSYDAALPWQLTYAFFGAAAFEGSIRWWSRGHRQHHRYTDTQKDPYSAKKGAFWSHMGWMLMKERPKNRGYVDITDLNKDPIVRWQHKLYLPIATLAAFVFPTVVAGYGWGDWLGGFFYAGVARLVFVHHATFCVNSLAHLIGEQTYDDRLTPRNHFITALVTLGEGYHNFHHEYPNDYRNAIKWWQYDPTKWVIWFGSLFGLTYNLNTFPDNEIRKGEIKQIEKKLAEEKAKLDYGTPVEDLPIMSWSDFRAAAPQQKLLVVDNVVYKVNDFMAKHPGGSNLLKASIGHDVTYQFNGGVYFHNNAARNMMSQYRFARIVEDGAAIGDLVVDDDAKWVGYASGKIKAQ